jgi:hypothetical protein
MDNVRDHLIEDVNDSNSLDLAQKNDWGRTKYIGYYGWASKINQPTKAIVETPENKGKQNQVTILDQMGLKIEVENDKETLTLINKLMGSNSSQIRKVYKVINTKTQKTFEDNFSKSKVKRKGFIGMVHVMRTGLILCKLGC